MLVITGVISSLPARGQAIPERVDGAADKTVFVLPLHGTIDKGMMMIFRRAFKDISRLQPDAVVIDIDTPGGRLLETEEILAWMRSVDVPIYAYVNPRALSAGAIISLGANAIFMAPGSRIGSALPIVISSGGGIEELPENVEEKMISDTRALVRGLAQRNGHSEDVAVAMVDPDHELTIGGRVVSAQGELLNLTAKEAVEIIPPRAKPLLAKAIVDDIEDLLVHQGIEQPRIVRFQAEPAEQLAKWIVTIGPALFSLGLLALFIEIRTPGLGLPGMAGVTLLMIYFFGHYVAGLAGIEDIALVGLGLILLALEIFVIPGFGIAGILGIALIAAGTMMGMVPHLPDGPVLPNVDNLNITDYFQGIMIRFVIIIALSAIGIYLLSKLLPKTAMYNRLILGKSLTKQSGYSSSEPGYADFIGKEGRARTALRPSGIAMFGNDRLDVVTSGDMIPQGARIRVIRVEGARVVVERAPDVE